MHKQTVLVDTSWLCNVWGMFLLLIKFKFIWKNGVSEKIKAHLPQHSQALQQLFNPHLLNFIQKCFAPCSFKKEGRDYAFYMRDYNTKDRQSYSIFIIILYTYICHSIWKIFLQNCKVIKHLKKIKKSYEKWYT